MDPYNNNVLHAHVTGDGSFILHQYPLVIPPTCLLVVDSLKLSLGRGDGLDKTEKLFKISGIGEAHLAVLCLHFQLVTICHRFISFLFELSNTYVQSDNLYYQSVRDTHQRWRRTTFAAHHPIPCGPSCLQTVVSIVSLSYFRIVLAHKAVIHFIPQRYEILLKLTIVSE